MSRATLVYIVMLVGGAGGLWLIVRAGAGLVAPTDLSGAWAVGGEDPSIFRYLGPTVFIEQSGRYVRLTFERGLRIDLKMIGETRPDPSAGAKLELRMAGGPWSLTALGTGPAGPLIFRLTGPAAHTFTVSRDAGQHAAVATGDTGAAAQAPTADAGAYAP